MADVSRENAEIDRMLEVARDSAREAGRLLVDGQRDGLRITKKGRADLVTDMDLAAERLIVGRILEEFPSHRILAEEEATSSHGTSPVQWIIDPLDGTTNYAHGYRFYCVSIALEQKGRLMLGVVYDPVTDELFEARRGRGATLNGSPIRVSTEESLPEALLCTGFAYDPQRVRENLKHFNRILPVARGVRRDGSAALDLCYVACGRFDAYWELSLHPWDVAAGRLVVEEAGGQVTRFDGSPGSVYDPETLATNGRLHGRLSRLLCEGE